MTRCLAAEIRIQDVQAGRVQDGSSSSYHNDASPGTLEKASNGIVDDGTAEVDRHGF
jgi:hypothetical protein